MMCKNVFILYQEYKKHISVLTREQKGALFEAIFEYNEGKEIELDAITSMAFSFIKSDLKMNKEKWEQETKKRSDNAKLGNLKRWHFDLYKKVISKEITLENAIDSISNKDLSPPIAPDRTQSLPIRDDQRRSQLSHSVSESESESESEINKKKYNKKKSPSDFHFSIANSLADFLMEKQKRNITKSQIESWADDIRLLMTKDISNRDDVKGDVVKAMQAVISKTDSPYFPEIESARSFRKKFIKIEQFIKRGNHGKSEVRDSVQAIDEQYNAIQARIDSQEKMAR
jgi:hypothetical protein